MAGLKAFRTLPKSLTEWGRWCQSQDILSSADIDELIQGISQTLIGTTNLSETGSGSDTWTVEFFDGDYQLLPDGHGKLLCSNSATACTLTVPSGVLDVGEQFTAMQYGAGTLTIAAAVGVTINTPSTLVLNEQFGTVTLICIDYDNYLIAGRMA